MIDAGDAFAALRGKAYLDHALRGPLPARTLAATRRSLEACALGSLARPSQNDAIEEARHAIAALLHGAPEEVAFVQNATTSLSTIAQGLGLGPGDRVVTNAGEFASNVLPWRALERAGVVVDVVPLREGRLQLEDVRRALDVAAAPSRRTILTLGAVSLGTGERRDLAAFGALAKRTGAFFVVDAAQALGALVIDARGWGIDALAGSSRKWLLGPPEAGILWVRRERLDELRVTAPGALSRGDPTAPPGEEAWRPDARRFEGGGLQAPVLAGLAESAKWLLELGPARVEEHALAAARELARRATAAGLEVLSPVDQGLSPIVRIAANGVTEQRLLERDVVARVERSGAVRLSPHFWTPEADLARAVAALEA